MDSNASEIFRVECVTAALMVLDSVLSERARRACERETLMSSGGRFFNIVDLADRLDAEAKVDR